MPKWEIDPRFRIAENESVLRHLEQAEPSAHSDVASELLHASAGLRGVHSWCPDPAAYAFVALHADSGEIFALAYGMSALALKIGTDNEPEAVADGARRDPNLGPGWVVFDPFDPEIPRKSMVAKLKQWTHFAFRAVHSEKR